MGHPGWFRPTPTEYDWLIEVSAPCRCPHCQGKVTAMGSHSPVDHLQEDILDNVYRVVCYQHEETDLNRAFRKTANDVCHGDGNIVALRLIHVV